MIQNAASLPLFYRSGTVPDVSGALRDYYQPMFFSKITKTVVDFQVIETTSPISFMGTWQPLSAQHLKMKPEGQRAWKWFLLHAEPTLILQPDDVITWNSIQTRVMARKDYALYGFIEYELVQDYLGVSP